MTFLAESDISAQWPVDSRYDKTTLCMRWMDNPKREYRETETAIYTRWLGGFQMGLSGERSCNSKCWDPIVSLLAYGQSWSRARIVDSRCPYMLKLGHMVQPFSISRSKIDHATNYTSWWATLCDTDASVEPTSWWPLNYLPLRSTLIYQSTSQDGKPANISVDLVIIGRVQNIAHFGRYRCIGGLNVGQKPSVEP